MGQIVEDKNPFTREFGTVTQTYIERELFKGDIERSFINETTDDRAYFIVGQELSHVEQDIISIMTVFGLSKVKYIREKYNEIFKGKRAEMTSSNFSKYRDKLIK